MTARTLVVTGTDTGVGKTRVAAALLRIARARGLRACGFKPVASGCDATPDGLRNADALALQQAAGTEEPYARLNPYAFEPAIAPHLAAQAAGRPIRVAHLNDVHAELTQRHDLIVLEGAGGWRVPFDETWSFAAWVAEREWPVLLVVGMRLGCLNHALLTAESITRHTRLAGWVACVLPPAMPWLAENLDSLRQRLAVPCWGIVAEDAPGFTDDVTVGAALARVLRAL